MHLTGDLESEPRQTSAPVRIINEIDNKQYEQKVKNRKIKDTRIGNAVRQCAYVRGASPS